MSDFVARVASCLDRKTAISGMDFMLVGSGVLDMFASSSSSSARTISSTRQRLDDGSRESGLKVIGRFLDCERVCLLVGGDVVSGGELLIHFLRPSLVVLVGGVASLSI